MRAGVGGFAVFVVALVFPPARAFAQEPVGSAQCCIELSFPLGAQSVALGRAVVADTLPDAVFVNPAGLAGLRKGAFVLHHRPLADGDQLNAITILFRPRGVGTFGLTYELVDLGQIEATDEQGNPIGNIVNQRHLVAASFATGLGAGVSLGATYKLFVVGGRCQGGCSDQPSGATQLVDVGVQYHPARIRSVAFGAAVVNAGLPLQIVNYEQSDAPPVRVRVGAAYELLHHFGVDSTLAVWVHAAVETGNPSPKRTVPALGAQLSVGNTVYLRAGWHPWSVVDAGFAMGTGLRFNRFDVSVGKAFGSTPLDPQGQPFHITLAVGF